LMGTPCRPILDDNIERTKERRTTKSEKGKGGEVAFVDTWSADYLHPGRKHEVRGIRHFSISRAIVWCSGSDTLLQFLDSPLL
jgi:hypothetical protein